MKKEEAPKGMAVVRGSMRVGRRIFLGIRLTRLVVMGVGRNGSNGVQSGNLVRMRQVPLKAGESSVRGLAAGGLGC